MLIGVALIPWIIRHPRSAAGALRGAHDNGPGRPVEDALRRIVVCLLRRVRVACGADHVLWNCEVAALAQIVGLEPAWDRSIPADGKATIRWQAQQIDSPLQQLLTGWPMTCRAKIVGLGEVLCCHATPRHENEVFTRLTPEDRLLPVFEGLDVPLVICGHTHVQFDRTIGKTRVVTLRQNSAPDPTDRRRRSVRRARPGRLSDHRVPGEPARERHPEKNRPVS